MFFFQAEGGIRDLTVTGVQTCALPISIGAGEAAPIPAPVAAQGSAQPRRPRLRHGNACSACRCRMEIGRASCRGRGEVSVGGGSFKKKKTTGAEQTVTLAGCCVHVNAD